VEHNIKNFWEDVSFAEPKYLYISLQGSKNKKKKIEARQEKERNMFVSEVNVQMLYRTDVISQKECVYLFTCFDDCFVL